MTNANFRSKDCQKFVSMKLPSYVIPDEISYHIFLSTMIVSNRIMAFDLHVFSHVLRLLFLLILIHLRSRHKTFAQTHEHTHTHRHKHTIQSTESHSRRQCFQSCLCSMLSVRCARAPLYLLVFFFSPFYIIISPVHQMPIYPVCRMVGAVIESVHLQNVHVTCEFNETEQNTSSATVTWARDVAKGNECERQINHRQLHKGVIWNRQKSCEQNKFT